ncbi:MAG TPA: hypothetical protein VKA70_17555 [Blastocatellia bacterium]|nr:hypothetical protein [Blastocatellia bacterium]
MKIITALVLTLTACCFAAAQEGRALNNTDEQLKARNAPDLFVIGVSAFGRDRRGRTSFVIEVQNMGEKTITAFDWEYAPARPIGKYRAGNPLKLRSDEEKIRPGEKKKLTEQVAEYTDELVTSFRLNSVRIVRVEYEGGSSWQRPAEEMK